MTSLSDGWAGGSQRALLGASSMEARLAIALTPVRSIIRVVDDSQPPMTVDWSKVGSDAKGKPLAMSYTDFAGSRIAINPLPIMDGKINAGAAIDVVAGFALHEASHAKHSRDRWKYLIRQVPDSINARKNPSIPYREEPAFRPMRIATYLWNLVEDVRIEAATTDDWRGFGPYFDNLLAWMWDTTIKDQVTPRVSFGPKVEDRLKLVFMACRFPARAAKMARSLQPEIAWWSAWQADYLSDAVDTPTTIQRGLDKLAEDEDTAAEMEEMTETETKERIRGEKLRAQIERLMKEGIAGAPMICITHDGDVRPLTQTEADRVDQLVREELVLASEIITCEGSSIAAIRVSKPMETADSRRAFIGRPDAATEALRASLVFRSERPQYEVKLQRSGDLDDEELYRWGMGDDRLFTQHVIETVPDTLLGLLVDMSGSMCGYTSDTTKLDIAQRLAQLFLWATHDMEGVQTVIWGHTGDGERGAGADIYRLWERGDPMSRLGLIDDLPHGNNYDGAALAYCADQMRREEQPQKVLLVLSDGYPSGHDYGGREAERHMRRTVDWARSQGVEVIQVAIDDTMRPADQERMYGPANWLPYVSEKQLPRDLTRILTRFTK
jgi:hypothetical protein